MKIIIDWLTARDNTSFSLTKLIGICTIAVMLVQFVRLGSVDFQGLSIGVAAMMAALAAKYYVEGKDK